MNNIIKFPTRRHIETVANEQKATTPAPAATPKPATTAKQSDDRTYEWECWTIIEGRMSNGKPTLRITRTNSKARFPKPKVNCYYHSDERRAQALEYFKASYTKQVERRAQRAQERREARNQPHTLEVGQCLYASWGYDQTNIDYYQVTRVSRRSVWFRQIDGRILESNGYMSSTVQPTKDSFRGEEQRRSVDSDNTVKFNRRYLHACAWTDTHNQTSYH